MKVWICFTAFSKSAKYSHLRLRIPELKVPPTPRANQVIIGADFVQLLYILIHHSFERLAVEEGILCTRIKTPQRDRGPLPSPDDEDNEIPQVVKELGPRYHKQNLQHSSKSSRTNSTLWFPWVDIQHHGLCSPSYRFGVSQTTTLFILQEIRYRWASLLPCPSASCAVLPLTFAVYIWEIIAPTYTVGWFIPFLFHFILFCLSLSWKFLCTINNMSAGTNQFRPSNVRGSILFDFYIHLSVSLISRFRSHSDPFSSMLLLLFLFLPNTMFSLTLSISVILQSTTRNLPSSSLRVTIVSLPLHVRFATPLLLMRNLDPQHGPCDATWVTLLRASDCLDVRL